MLLFLLLLLLLLLLYLSAGLEDIAGSRERTMHLKNFEDLGRKAKSLLAKVCTAVLPQPCKSNPCKHGSCLERSNDYKCKCEAGYIGKNCDEGMKYPPPGVNIIGGCYWLEYLLSVHTLHSGSFIFIAVV